MARWTTYRVGTCLLLIGCSGGREQAATIARADKLVLYEGLPHQNSEAKALAREEASKPTLKLHGYPFYRETLALKPEDADALKKVLADPATFEDHPEGSVKACGGFHPDYLLEWSTGKDTYRCQVCLGCHEAKLFGPTSNQHFDIERAAYQRLRALLKPYRKNRPLPAPPAAGPQESPARPPRNEADRAATYARLVPFCDDGKWGYIDREGKVGAGLIRGYGSNGEIRSDLRCLLFFS